MIIIIPNYLKPLGWLLWKLRIALRVINALGDIDIYSDGKKLEEGKDYTIPAGYIIFITTPNEIKVKRSVKNCMYIIKLFE